MEFIGSEIGGRLFDRSMFHGTMLSIGVGEDISFELEAIKAGVKVFLFDPTPRSVEFMKKYPDIPYFRIGISDINGWERFYYPQNGDHVSCSAVNLQGTADYFIGQVVDINGAINLIHEFHGPHVVNIINMNIEGSEYKVLDWMRKVVFYPDILIVEFHPNEDRGPYLEQLSRIYNSMEVYNDQYLWFHKTCTN